MPDVFVPLDTTRYTKFYTSVNRHNIIVDLVLRHVDNHRKSLLKKYKDFEDYITSYEVPDELLEEVFRKAKDKGIEPKDDEEQKAARQDLREVLKSLIAYNVWDRNEYFRLTNQKNDIVKRGLEIIRKQQAVSPAMSIP